MIPTESEKWSEFSSVNPKETGFFSEIPVSSVSPVAPIYDNSLKKSFIDPEEMSYEVKKLEEFKFVVSEKRKELPVLGTPQSKKPRTSLFDLPAPTHSQTLSFSLPGSAASGQTNLFWKEEVVPIQQPKKSLFPVQTQEDLFSLSTSSNSANPSNLFAKANHFESSPSSMITQLPLFSPSSHSFLSSTKSFSTPSPPSFSKENSVSLMLKKFIAKAQSLPDTCDSSSPPPPFASAKVYC